MATIPNPHKSPAIANHYRLLARYGLTPRSTARQVFDATLEMSPEEMSDEAVMAAWDSLRISRSRLMTDFFHLDLPPEPPSRSVPPERRPTTLPWALLASLSAFLAEHGAANAARPAPGVEMPPSLFRANLPGAAPGETESQG